MRQEDEIHKVLAVIYSLLAYFNSIENINEKLLLYFREDSDKK